MPSSGGDVRLTGPREPAYDEILSAEAIEFVATLVRRFQPSLQQLLSKRLKIQAAFDSGEQKLDFNAHTKDIREKEWKVGKLPRDLLDRRVEITGPPDRKMVINALNSGASVFMADFEDSNAPSWSNQIEGQLNLRDAVRKAIAFKDPKSGKSYQLKSKVATLMVRPRGLHLMEKHFLVSGKPIPGCLLDFGLYFFHNARFLLERGSGPYFYLPKMQDHLEARWYNNVFMEAQHLLGIPIGTIKATVLIETLPAAFQMDEILWELRAHSAGLNCGRWDYIFSFIKTFRADSTAIMPDRGVVTMTQPCMLAYSLLLIRTCHRRGVHAMGGMAAQIPIKNDPKANEAALVKVRADKTREVKDGHDGTWVAHPALVTIAKEIFDEHMTTPNQIHVARKDVHKGAADLLEIPRGPRSLTTLRSNVSVGVQYLEAWLGGLGCVPIDNLMEDAATAEICRTQVWQWLHHGVTLDGGEVMTTKLVSDIMEEELAKLCNKLGDQRFNGGHFKEASKMFYNFSTAETLADFLTLAAYERLVQQSSRL